MQVSGHRPRMLRHILMTLAVRLATAFGHVVAARERLRGK